MSIAYHLLHVCMKCKNKTKENRKTDKQIKTNKRLLVLHLYANIDYYIYNLYIGYNLIDHFIFSNTII